MFFTALKNLIVDSLDELDTIAAEACNSLNVKHQEKQDETSEDKTISKE